MTTATLQDKTRQDPPDNSIEAFLDHLRDSGYAEYTLWKKRSILKCFAQWTKQKRITVDDLNDCHVEAFVGRSPRRGKDQVVFELAVLRQFFRYLHLGVGLQDPPVQNDMSSAIGLLRCYEDYLRRDRGLAENSVHVYVAFIRHYLASLATPTGCISPQSFDTFAIRDFVLGQTHNRSAEYVRLLATALRSFFRFLFLSGQVPRDLAPSAQSLQIPPNHSARVSLTRGGRTRVDSHGSIDTHWAARLCHSASPGSARSACGRNCLA